VGFLYGMGSAAVFALLYFVWWWTNRGLRLGDRAAGFLLILAGCPVVEPFCHPSVGWFGLLTSGLPVVLTAWTLGIVALRKASLPWKRLAAPGVVALAWGVFALIRIDGLDADLRPELRWRWAPSAEDLFRAEKAGAADAADDTRLAALAAWAP